MTPRRVEEPAPPGTPQLKRPPTPALDEAESVDFSILSETETGSMAATGPGQESEGAGPTGALEVDGDVVIIGTARARSPPQDQHAAVDRTVVHARPVVKSLLEELTSFLDKVVLWPTCAENEVKVICYRPVSGPFNKSLCVNVDGTTVKDGDVDEEVVYVVDFKRNEDGRPGPIESHGRVKPNMWVSSINGASTLGLGYHQTLRMLRPDMTKGCFCLGFAPVLPAAVEGAAVESMDVGEGGEHNDGADIRVRLDGRAWGGAWEEREEMQITWVPRARTLAAAVFPGWGRGDETFVSTLLVMMSNTDGGRTWTWPGVKVNCQCKVKGVKMIPHMLCYGGHHTKPQSRYETRPIILGELWQLLAKRRGDPGIEEYQLQMDYKAALSFAIAVCLFEINAKQRNLTLTEALQPYQRWFIVNPFVHRACGKIMCSCEDGGAKAAQSESSDRHPACKRRRFECREASCGLVLRVYDWAKRTGAIPANVYDEDVELFSKRSATGDSGSSTNTKQRRISPTTKATTSSAAAPSATPAAPQRANVVLPRPLPTHPPTYSYYLNHHAAGNVHISVKPNTKPKATSSTPPLLAPSTAELPPQLSPGHMDEFYRLSEVRRQQMREQLEREIWLVRQHNVVQQQQQQQYVVSPNHQLQHQQQYALNQSLPHLRRTSPTSTHQQPPQLSPRLLLQAAPQQQQQQQQAHAQSQWSATPPLGSVQQQQQQRREADGQSKHQAPIRHALLLDETSPQSGVRPPQHQQPPQALPAASEGKSSGQLVQLPSQVLQQQQQQLRPFPQQLERPPAPPQPPSGQQQQLMPSSTQPHQQPVHHHEQPKARVPSIPLPPQEYTQARAAPEPLLQRCSQSTQTDDNAPEAVDAIAPPQITPVEVLAAEDHEEIAQVHKTLARTLQALVDKDPAADDCTTFARKYLTTLMQMIKRGEKKETVDAIVKVLGASIEDCTEAPRRCRKRKRDMDKAQKELADLSSGSMPTAAADSGDVQPQASLETVASSSLGGANSIADANVSVADTPHARLEAAREAVEHAKVCRESWERLVVWVERCFPAWKKELDAMREEQKARKTQGMAVEKAPL